MANSERRSGVIPRRAALKRELNPAQLQTLHDLEMFGWELKFVRHRPFFDPTPVVVDPSGKKYLVIRSDGSLDDRPLLNVRH